ncbi:MAG: lipoprotein signal peptidase [Gammaproteobacteria bacterium]|nr:lipoprotein signal peptidase [Gammaproteobacteria bacterium]
MMVKWLVIAGLVIGLDRVTKIIAAASLDLGEYVPVLPVFGWVHLNNTGAAFSMFADAGGIQRWLFVLLAIGFSVYLIFELRKIAVPTSIVERLAAWGYALILGGAIGNMWDRAYQGFVVDFILVHYDDSYFPAFNVADSAITIGAGLWIISMIMESRQARRARAEQ